MGWYINPTDMSKENFIGKYGVNGDKADILCIDDYNKVIEQGLMPVIWIHNGPFTAAAIITPREQQSANRAFFDPEDFRPKRYIRLPISELTQFIPEDMDIMDISK